jgi:hypothetical protein
MVRPWAIGVCFLKGMEFAFAMALAFLRPLVELWLYRRRCLRAAIEVE